MKIILIRQTFKKVINSSMHTLLYTAVAAYCDASGNDCGDPSLCHLLPDTHQYTCKGMSKLAL